MSINLDFKSLRGLIFKIDRQLKIYNTVTLRNSGQRFPI